MYSSHISILLYYDIFYIFQFVCYFLFPYLISCFGLLTSFNFLLIICLLVFVNVVYILVNVIIDFNGAI